MAYISTFLAHSEAVRRAAAGCDAETLVRISDYSLGIHKEGREVRWQPKFIARMQGKLVYVAMQVPGTVGFAGWSPYPIRQWPAATSKSAFKRLAIAQGIATPAACFDPQRIQGPFLIKHTASSFGEGMRGPFSAYDAENPAHQLDEGEYYENFIVGLIAKAWCWGGECFALHLDPPISVVGNGEVNVRELVRALPDRQQEPHDWGLIQRMAHICGVPSLDAVLPAGKEVLVEYRYGSRYAVEGNDNPNVLGRLRDQRVVQQFAHAARAFAASIPREAGIGPSYYTLDAMVDSAGDVFFLEMNCNPLVHPDLYAPMLAGAFGGGSAQVHERVPGDTEVHAPPHVAPPIRTARDALAA